MAREKGDSAYVGKLLKSLSRDAVTRPGRFPRGVAKSDGSALEKKLRQ